MMKLVSETSQEEIDTNRALEKVGYCMRELSANLLRVIRGAGKPYEIERQARELCTAFDDYRAVATYGIPSHLMAAELNPELLRAKFRPWTAEPGNVPPRDEFGAATDRIVAGALQMTASRLLDQLTQESCGIGELMKGVQELERVRHQNRRT